MPPFEPSSIDPNLRKIALELSDEYKETVSRFKDFSERLNHLLVKLAVIASWVDMDISRTDTFFLKDFFLLYLGFPEALYTPVLRNARIQVQQGDESLNAESLPEGMKIFAFRFWIAVSKADGEIYRSMAPFFEKKTKAVESALLGSLSPEKKGSIGPEQAKEEPKTLEQVMEELNSLIGLVDLKKEIQTLINFLQVQKRRKDEGLAHSQITFHSVFYGNPGTGKTTVGRLLGKILKAMGFLQSGHLVETDRAGLVGQYVGHTAQKTDAVIHNAMDGLLFIDEAYSLVQSGDRGNDFGSEAIDIIIKRMEDFRDRLVIIVAGYTKEMDTFIQSNPGLESRFTNYFHFPDYSPEELFKIFCIFCKKDNYTLPENSKESLEKLINKIYENRDRNFGNGRIMRNLFQRIIRNQANRLTTLTNISRDDLLLINPEDIPDNFS